MLPPLMEAVGGVALVAALFYGSHAIRSGRLTTGAFASFLAALFAMYTPIKRLSRVNATLQGALAAGERIFEVLDTHQEVRERPDAMPLPRMQREIEYRGRGVPLRRLGRRRPAAASIFSRPGGRGGGHRGHERGGQDDARQPAAALLRRDRGRDHSSTAWTSARSRSRACASRSAS